VELRVLAPAEADEDSAEATVWTERLLAELSCLDDARVEQVAEEAPEGAKGIGAASGTILARVANLDAFKALVEVLRSWTTRIGRTVEVSVDGDTLKLTGATREQQDRVIEAWIARHTPSA
jgi:hypothetical protein